MSTTCKDCGGIMLGDSDKVIPGQCQCSLAAISCSPSFMKLPTKHLLENSIIGSQLLKSQSDKTMTHQDHTPGPWEFSSPGPCPEMEPGIIFGGKPVRLIGQGDRDADVRLMAMAPEMLTVCVWAMDLMHTVIQDGEISQLEANRLWESARAVVGRADVKQGLKMEGLLSWASARLKQVKVNVAARDLVKRVERREGWHSDIDGHRLKDTPEWCAFYVAVRALDEEPEISSRCAKLAEMEGDESPSACGPDMHSRLNGTDCPECEGTGRRSFYECDDLVDCVDCNGTGIISSENSQANPPAGLG